MREYDLSTAQWRKSMYSNGQGGDCVEVLDDVPGVVPVRDSKTPSGPRPRHRGRRLDGIRRQRQPLRRRGRRRCRERVGANSRSPPGGYSGGTSSFAVDRILRRQRVISDRFRSSRSGSWRINSCSNTPQPFFLMNAASESPIGTSHTTDTGVPFSRTTEAKSSSK